MPGLTTFGALFSMPINDKSGLLEPNHFGMLHLPGCIHSDMASCRRSSLSCGRWSLLTKVSISMPRNVSEGAGPSVFSGATERPTLLHMARVAARACLQISELEGPVGKSCPNSEETGPLSDIISPLAREEKSLAANLRPKGRARSMYTIPLCCTARSAWSAGWMGTAL